MTRYVVLMVFAVVLTLAPVGVAGSSVKAKKPTLNPTICLTKPTACKPIYS